MERAYLEEDIQLIQRYFPGAKTVNLRTPFDIRVSGHPRTGIRQAACRPEKRGRWFGDLVWERL